EEVLPSSVNGRHPGRKQIARAGSYMYVPPSIILNELTSFTINLWVYPTSLPSSAAQGIVSKWSEGGGGFGLRMDSEGHVEVWIGQIDGEAGIVSSPLPLVEREWHSVTVVYDAEAPKVRLMHASTRKFRSNGAFAISYAISDTTVSRSDGPLLLGAWKLNG